MPKFILAIQLTHSLFPQQIDLLGGTEGFIRVDIPEAGIAAPDVPAFAARLAGLVAEHDGSRLVIGSPFAALMAELSRRGVPFGVLHNDKRDAKEVPDGKGGTRVIHAVSPTGWIVY